MPASGARGPRFRRVWGSGSGSVKMSFGNGCMRFSLWGLGDAPVWWSVTCFRDGHCTIPERDSEIAPPWSIVAPEGTARHGSAIHSLSGTIEALRFCDNDGPH